jgi:hypothetical protein
MLRELLVALLLMAYNVAIQGLGTFAPMQWGLRLLKDTRSLQ